MDDDIDYLIMTDDIDSQLSVSIPSRHKRVTSDLAGHAVYPNMINKSLYERTLGKSNSAGTGHGSLRTWKLPGIVNSDSTNRGQ